MSKINPNAEDHAEAKAYYTHWSHVSEAAVTRRARLNALERITNKLHPVYPDESRMKSILLELIQVVKGD